MTLKKTCVVTGGGGFLGSHLCERFLERNWRVIAVDNFITGNEKNIAPLKKNKAFQLIRRDVSKFIRIPGRIDYVLHFASPASPLDYLQFPIQTLKVGALGTHNALGLAKDKKAVFFLASTSEVYGDPHEHPQKESYWGNVNPIGIRACYDEGKRCAEALFVNYHRQNNVRIKLLRIFNTYGPRMHPNDGRVVSNFIVQALKGQDITVYGDGSQTRSFCYVDDLIDAMIKLMNTPDHFLGPVNAGNPNEFTIHELAEMVIKRTNSKSKIIFKPLPEDDPLQRKPDIALAKKELQWEPKIMLEEGLNKTINYFKSIS